ncbi:MAG: glycosyltransferase family 2 protein, partial [Candidatus Hodarchaeota archaeon]
AFIDDDAVAEKDWLEKLTEPFQSQNVVAVGGRAIPIWSNGTRPLWFPEELDWIVGCTYKGLPLKGNEIRNVPGGNMAFRKEVFEQAGYWQTEIGGTGQSQKGGEEAELCLRIKSEISNALIVYEPNATIHHRVPSHRASPKWVFKNSFDQGICKAKVNKISSTQEALTVENSYLRYLLCTSIPQRLKHFYKKGSLSQIVIIVLSIAATGVGYLVGKVKG